MRHRAVLPLMVLAAIAAAPLAPAQATDGKLSLTRIAELAKPATILIVINHRTQVQVPNDAMIRPQQQALLVRQVAPRVNRSMGKNEILNLLIDEVATNWQAYLTPIGSATKSLSITSVGSGFFVTPDGYAVTNAHVVGSSEKEMKTAFVQNALNALLQQTAKQFESAFAQYGTVTPEAKQKLLQAATAFYVSNMQMGEISKSATVMLGVGQPGMGITAKPIPVEIVKNAVGEPIPGKDVAVVKANGDNFPVLPLGDDKALSTGEEIYPLGYPADATFFPSFDAASANEPSLTRGIVSGKKTMAGGWEVIQTDAAIRGGNSGGPVMNTKGEVIGLATFGLVDQKSGGSAVGANFVVPTTVVKEILGRANVQSKSSPSSDAWREALTLADEGRLTPAVEKMREIESMRPGLAPVQQKMSSVQADIRAGKEKHPFPIALVIGGLVVLGAIAGILVVVLGRGRKGQVVAAPQGQIPPTQLPPAPPKSLD